MEESAIESFQYLIPYLSTRDAISVCLTCRRLYVYVTDDGSELWRTLKMRDFSHIDARKYPSLKDCWKTLTTMRNESLRQHGNGVDQMDDAFLYGTQLEATTMPNLDRANLVRANCTGSRFGRCTNSDLSYSTLMGCTFIGYPSLEGTKLIGANLRHAELWNVYLGQVDMTGADLTGANLKGAFFYQTKFDDVCFIDADLTGCHFQLHHKAAPELVGIDVSRAVFSACDMDLAFKEARRGRRRPDTRPMPVRKRLALVCVVFIIGAVIFMPIIAIILRKRD